MTRPETVGTRIRRARQRLRMSQGELARRIGVSRNSVNAWENDRAYPVTALGALEDVLGVRLTDEPAPPAYDDPALQHIWETPGLPEDVRRGLVALAIGMRAQAAQRRAG